MLIMEKPDRLDIGFTLLITLTPFRKATVLLVCVLSKEFLKILSSNKPVSFTVPYPGGFVS